MRRSPSAALLTLAAVAALTGGCRSHDPGAAFLDAAWPRYRDAYIHPDGYVLDRRRDGGTVTSEGQGYALLRAVWERDASTFDRILRWTEAHLQREDGLHAWLWQPGGEDGREGEVVDPNSATDGDLEIAWALAMAATLFDRPDHARRATDILRAVRAHASIPVGDAWFPAAGDWAVEERITNLSYFVPYAHPWFQALDPHGNWEAVTDVGYALLERSVAGEALLPPAFGRLTEAGELLPLEPGGPLDGGFSFDAVRLFWRVEADCALTGRARACADPLRTARAAGALVVDGRIHTAYTLHGEPLARDESTSFYAALLPAFRRHVPELARDVLEPRLGTLDLEVLLRTGDRYWDHNWVWFGLALDRGLLADRTPAPPARVQEP